MNTNINLLLRADEETLKRLRRVKRFNFIAITSLIGVGSLSLLLFLLIQIINPSSVRTQQNEIREKISKLQDRQAKLFVLNNRINNIEKILQRRIDLSYVNNSLLAKIPGRLFIEDLEIDDKAVVMTAQSTSLSAIGELINNLTDMVRKKEIIKSLTLSTLLFDESKNSYQVSVEAEL
ncbi:MAG: hypothetical protein HYW62_01435 [Candidatus Levybacteria bacterium]|nr:hypothetical protein [Candidatus Levybacteria bacterium]